MMDMSQTSESQQIHTHLAEQQSHLAELYHQALRQTLFSSRGQVRPASLKGIAAAEAQIVLDFFYHSDPARSRQRGVQLCQLGLAEEAVLRLGQATRQFCLTCLPEHLHIPAMNLAESYHSAAMQGFIETRVAAVLEEQERIRTALQRALNRAVVQMEAAADIAQAATSILDLNELLNTSVELISERFDFYYVGIFLSDEYGRWAILRAGSGQAGQEMLRRGHKLEVGGNSMIGWCVAHRQPRIAQDVGKEAVRFDNPWLPQTRSEMALPLISRDAVIGAMTVQSSRVAAFSEQDIASLQVLTGQMANAIQNSRLFTEAQTSLAEVQAAQRRYVRESWPETTRVMPGYLYEQSTDVFASADDLWRPEMEQAIREKQPVVSSTAVTSSSQAALAVPITLRGETIGVLDLYDIAEHRQWSDDEVELVSAVMSQAALTIDNARLFDETARRARETTVIQQITALINASDDIIKDLKQIARLLRELAPADVIGLTNYTPGEPEFTYSTAGADSDPSLQLDTQLPLKGSGLEWAIAHQESSLEADIRQKQSFVEDEQLAAQGLVSRLLLPLHIQERVIGTLNLASTKPGAFSEQLLPTLNQIADQMALALERSRLLEETQAALTEVEATHRRYLQEEWEDMLTTTKHTWGYLDSPEGLASADQIWTPEIEQAITTGEPATWTAPQEGDDQAQRNALALPIRLRGQTIGVLDFYHIGEERTWTENDKALVQALADQVALTLETQRLFEQTQRRAFRERVTGEITSKIRAAGDVHSILETAAEELGRVLGVSRTLIRLGNPNDGTEDLPPNSQLEGASK
jgi:GAF domain-containing protein